jgi:hypothetical protein
MERMLQKKAEGLSVRYSNKDYSNNLTGRAFKIVQRLGHPCLSIDLGGNLHVRNKSANCYQDALDLIEQHALLEFLQIDEDQVVRDFAQRAKVVPAKWKMELNVGEKGVYLYSVSNLKLSSGSAFFDVRFEEAGSAK